MLDDRDQKILMLLEDNARIPISALARAVNLSPTAVRQRMARMEREGTIEGFTVLRKKPDATSAMQAVVMLQLTGSFCKRLKEAFGHLPEIRKFWSTAGELDAVMLLEVSSVQRLNEITSQLNDHDLVSRIQTHLITETQLDR